LCRELSGFDPTAQIILAGDFNQLSNEVIEERTGLKQVVSQPTRGVNILDRIYVSNPLLFSIIRVVTSVVRSDHNAIVAFSELHQAAQRKSTYQCTFRRKNPTQHALFLQHVSGMTFVNHEPAASSDSSVNTQAEFDSFYSSALALLKKFYPEKTATMTTREPISINPEIKYKLRRKKRLMRAGRVEEAGALAERIGKDMTRHSKTQFSKIDSKANVKDMWQLCEN
jgi:hypothetical protein